jgi:hypothetical protein
VGDGVADAPLVRRDVERVGSAPTGDGDAAISTLLRGRSHRVSDVVEQHSSRREHGGAAVEVREIAHLADERTEAGARTLRVLHELQLALAERADLLAREHPQVAGHDGDRGTELVHRQREQVGLVGGWRL